ncbi:MAG TPA: hypothetical protein VNI77_03455 [Nitrososphaera sp.]|nr:hypothetical protein [Nitrososphaera sp.]
MLAGQVPIAVLESSEKTIAETMRVFEGGRAYQSPSSFYSGKVVGP